MDRLFITYSGAAIGELDLFPETKIAITVQFWNPLTPDVIRGSYSNRIKLPITNNNKALLGITENFLIGGGNWTLVRPARYIREGLEVIPNGQIYVSGINKNQFEVILVGNDFDLFSKLSSKSLIDLDFTDYTNGWAIGDYDTLRNELSNLQNDTGGKGTLMSLLMNYKDAADHLSYNGPFNCINSYVFKLACFGYKPLVGRVLTQAGYTYTWGKLRDGSHDNPKFNRLAILQQTNLPHRLSIPDKFKQPYLFAVEKSADEAIVVNTGINTYKNVPFDTVKIASIYWGSPTANKYNFSEPLTAVAIIVMQCTFSCQVAVTGASCKLVIRVNGTSNMGATASLAAGGTYNISLTGIGNLKNGDLIEVMVQQDTAGATTATIKKGAQWFTTEVYWLDSTTYVKWNYAMPDVSQLALFKDFLFRFGQMPKIKGNTISFKSFNDILTDVTNLNDWSGKALETRAPDTDLATFFGLAQKNYFTYQNYDGGDGSKITDYYSSGNFSIQRTWLQATKTFQSIFASTEDGVTQISTLPYFRSALIKCYQATGILGESYTRDAGLRIVNVRMKDPDEPAIYSGSGAARTDYNIGCWTFAGIDQNDSSLGYDAVLSEWYSTFIKAIKDSKVVTRYYKLSANDVYNFDPHKMIFDNGQYYMFPTFSNFIPGKLTKVTMLKLNNNL